MAREVVSGAVGGLVAAGLMRIVAPPPSMSASKEVIPLQNLPSGGSVTLKGPTTYKFAVILFHGDGESQVRLDIVKGATTISIRANEQAIEILANESISITAVNEDTIAPRAAPTIEIASLSW
jgi:hypothetical protein